MISLQNLYHHLAAGNPPPDSVVKLLDRHLKLGHNVIMSSEKWSLLSNEADVILEALLSMLVGFDVTIVVAYRHYHEWLPSVYFQQNYHPTFFTRHHVIIPTFEKYMDSHSLSKVDYNNDKTIMTTRMAHHHPTVNSVLRYSKHCKHVVIFDMHDDGHDHNHHNNSPGNGAGDVDLVTNFVCRALPTAEKTCKLLQIRQQQPKNNGNEIDTRQRSSTAMETTILSSFAYSRAQQSPTFSTKIGELQKKWRMKSAAKTKEIIFKRLTAAVNRLFRDRYFPSSSTGKEDTAAAAGMTIGNSTVNTARTTVPMTCPSVEKLEKLLNMSMASDKFITSRREWQDLYYDAGDGGDGSNNNMDSAEDRLLETRSTRDSYIRERFAKSVAVQKFCSIDLEAIRSDPFWIDFLESLDPIDLWLEKLSK